MRSEFKIELGTIFKDCKRDITIIDRKYIKGKGKCYKYKCNKCGFDCGKHWSVQDKKYKDELWITESNLLQGNGCSCCCTPTRIIIKGINDIATTHPHLIKYFKNIQDTYINTISCINKTWFKCPDCGTEYFRKIDGISRYGYSCKRCSDKISFGEKIIFNIFKQLELNFQTQLTKTTFDWCQDYRYDFYFEYNSEPYICEVNGIQHYEDNTNWIMSLKEIHENDVLKKQLALKNGIKEENYIVVDCRYSTLNWIKNNILNDIKITNKFNVDKINWLKAEEFALKNRVKEACDIKRMNPDMSTTEIGEIMKMHIGTIRKFLKQGTELGWCTYNIEYEKRKRILNLIRTDKTISIFKEGVILGIFKSTLELERKSEELFGEKLYNPNVCRVCNNKKPQYKGYTFKYIENLTPEEYIKYDIENKLKELHNRELGQAC